MGAKTTKYLDGKVNPWSDGFKERYSVINPSISAPPLVSPYPGIVGSFLGAGGAELTNKYVTEANNSSTEVKKTDKANDSSIEVMK
ncbi:hypothetical protein J8V57_13625 [Xenorhabdus sp. PB61.4]|uniref:hypothetical protein n=1 Tax=Xenorhabdus sp. PB61.4 TaxID=2788940 RepID=UPI001E60E645|nr:hypothetical protein [Xenorhabdus sp. PB61.4]MCC8367295.1 hypothetical protein [Xenorhabdus sp. PB61.4]